MTKKNTITVYPWTIGLIVIFMGALQIMAYSVEEANHDMLLWLMGTVIVGILVSGLMLKFKKLENLSDALRSFLVSVPVAVFLQLADKLPFINISQRTSMEAGLVAGVVLFIAVLLGMVAFKIKR